MPTILIVEDDLALRETLVYNLRREDYQVISAADGPTGLSEARRLKPDLILLDIMLPGIDGLEICRTLRQELNTPILLLTARDDEIDRVIGLEIGADDYITKPFSMRELLARIKAHLRRERLHRQEVEGRSEGGKHELLHFGNLLLDLTRHEVLLDEKPLPLTPMEFELLHFLARHRGQALSRDHLLQEVWGWDYSGGTRTVDVHIRWLREKIEADPARPTRLVTVRGSGYRFEG